jgi:aspartokinase
VFETIHAYFKEMRDLAKGLAALGELTPRIMDAMASYGERLSTAILTQVLENQDSGAAHGRTAVHHGR